MAAALEPTATPGVYRRGGRYVVRYRDDLGRQRQESAGTTLAAARALLAERRADVHRGEHRDTSRATFATYAAGWIRTYTGRTRSGIRPETLADYGRALGLTTTGEPILRDGHATGALAHFGRMRLAEIQPRHVRDYMAGLAGRGLSPNSVRLQVAALRVLFATAYTDGDIRSNPCTGVRATAIRGGEIEAEQVRALADAELAALVEATPERRRLLVRFLAETGLRISEAMELRWSDVDLGQRRLHVRRRLYRGKVAGPKSRYGRRSVPLSAHIARELWTRRAGAADDGLVFPNRDGGHLNSSNVHRWFKPAAERAGVPWAGLHTLRHTCATNLFRHGLNAKQAQIWLGHHSPAFTLAVYTHLLSDDLPPSPFDAIESPEGVNKVLSRPTETSRERAEAEVAESA